MGNIFIIAGVISLIFTIAKFIEMRFVEKESKPLKVLVRDAILVYFSVIIGDFFIQQFSSQEIVNSKPYVFVGEPDI